MAGVFRLYNNLIIKRFLQPSVINIRTITTSKKNSDAAAPTLPQPTGCTTKESSAISKNWVSYGFDFNDQAADKNATHSIFFFAITLCMIVGGFMWTYIPDYQLRDWAQREAYLELRRREKAGLPLIDANLVDPASVTLPDDDELGNTEIII